MSLTISHPRHAGAPAPVVELRVSEVHPDYEEMTESELIELAIAIVDAGVVTHRAQTMLCRIDHALRLIECTESE